ncbi:MAG TPA: hypothetical protein VKD72_07240 [Gemmataceae bacterium]|nr:hypothetical protein [Gemmataceae bacterium]
MPEWVHSKNAEIPSEVVDVPKCPPPSDGLGQTWDEDKRRSAARIDVMDSIAA